MRLTSLALLYVFAVASLPVFSAETKFTIGEHGVQLNTVSIESSTDLETIVTTSNAMTGVLMWDREAKSGSAKLSVPVASLKTGIPDRDGHLQGEGWLNAAKFPTITFETTSVTYKDGDTYDVTGKFTMRGVTKDLTATVTLKYLPHNPGLDEILPKANFVKIRTTFDLKLSDFGITFPVIGLKVSDTLKVKVALLGVDETR